MGRVAIAGVLLACVVACGGRIVADLDLHGTRPATADAASVDEPNVDAARAPVGSDASDGAPGAPVANNAGGVVENAPVDGLPACAWPANLGDAGPGACRVGRAFVGCRYPSGVICEGGAGASFGSMACISDDPTSCSGCGSIAGEATCTDMCAPNEYAVSCGGFGNFAYQDPPATCVGIGFTPGGSGFYCCPCE